MPACYCRGGPTCCIRTPVFGPPGPFKCHECGIWWTGMEHRCRKDRSIAISTDTSGSPDAAPDTFRLSFESIKD